MLKLNSAIKVKFQSVCVCVCLHNSRTRLFIFIANLLLHLHNVSIFTCPTSFILHIFYMNNSSQKIKNIHPVNRKKGTSQNTRKKRIVAS